MSYHKHSCCHTDTPFQENPETVWEHPNDCSERTDITTAAFNAAHTCPTCGKNVRWQYLGTKPATHVGQCDRPMVAVIALPPVKKIVV